MKVSLTFIRELSQKIKILVMSTPEIKRELRSISSDISHLSYKSWVLETFVPSVNILFGYIVERGQEEGMEEIQRLKEAVYNRVVKLNPIISPENLYIDLNNSVTLSKNKFKLTECDSWDQKKDESSIAILDFFDYFEMSEQARGHDHAVETEHWDLLDMQVKVRIFPKTLKNSLLFGIDPETEDDIRYFVVAVCIDSFHQIYKYVSSDPSLNHISFSKLINSLYEVAIRSNPFLQVSVKEVKKINRSTRQFRAGTEDHLIDYSANTSARKSLSKVTKNEIVNLETSLKNRVFGQDEAVIAVCNSIKRAYLGLKLRNKPIGAFLFYGPTSTGKTELAKAIAETLIKSVDKGLISIPCGSTVQGSHSIDTLIGSPPGYVGYEEKGALANALEKGKFKVLLFDEVDKATPKLFDLVLEMLEEGRIMAADGNVLDVRECIIIFTSNMGQDEVKKVENSTGFESTWATTDKKNKAAEVYKKTILEKLKPEFIARLSGMFYFKPLEEADLIKTADLHLKRYVKSWKKKLKLTYHPDVCISIVSKCKDMFNKFHARNIKDYIDSEIVQKLGDYIINANIDLKKVEKIEIVEDLDRQFVFNIVIKAKTKKPSKEEGKTLSRIPGLKRRSSK